MSQLARPLAVVERNVMAYRRMWVIFLTGLSEPFLYLLSIGIGVGALVGTIEVDGRQIPYERFVAPGLLASAAMNGAVFDATFNFFFKVKYAHTFEAMLATPLGVRDVAVGEMAWTLLRSSFYAAAFLATMWALDLVSSPWAVLGVPAALLIGFAFSGAGMAASSFMRSFVHFDYVNLVLVPLFLFSGIFFPLSQYPAGLDVLVQVTPLYQGVALERGLTVGHLDWSLLGHTAYLVALGALGVRITAARLSSLLQP